MFQASLWAFFRRVSVLLLAGALAAVTLGVTAEAQAQAAAAKAPTKKTRDAARAAYTGGEKAYDEGDYASAVEQFRKANDIIPSPHAKYWIAKSLDKQDRVSDAIEAYEIFVNDADASKAGADKIDEAKNRITELKGKLEGELFITTTPAAAQVTVDGTPQTGETPFSVKVPPGRHKIAVSAAGFETKEIEVEVAGGGRTEQNVELSPEVAADITTPPAPPVTAPAETAPPREKKSKVPAYVTLGIAGVGAIVGTIFGIQALSAQSDFDENPTTEAADDVERNALIADMAFGVAITLGVTGIVLLTSASDDPETPAATRPAPRRARLNVAPVISPTGGGAAARLVF
jgi:hypothetical protein